MNRVSLGGRRKEGGRRKNKRKNAEVVVTHILQNISLTCILRAMTEFTPIDWHPYNLEMYSLFTDNELI